MHRFVIRLSDDLSDDLRASGAAREPDRSPGPELSGTASGTTCATTTRASIRVRTVDPAALRQARLHRIGLAAVLVATMTLGPFPLMAPAIVAVDLIAGLGITTGTFALAVSLNTVAAAAFAPLSGRLTDSIGPKQSCVLTMLTSGLGLVWMSSAGNVWHLIAGSVFAGIGQGWCNPATNRLIADRIAPGRRGTITGFKQSGVMFGQLLAGATLPTLAAWFGWRYAMAVYGVLSVVAGLLVLVALSADDESRPPSTPKAGRALRRPVGAVHAAAMPRRRVGSASRTGSSRRRATTHAGASSSPGENSRREGRGAPSPTDSVSVSSSPGPEGPTAAMRLVQPPSGRVFGVMRGYIVMLAWYSLLMGAIVGGVGRFLPLYAEQTLGWSNFWAGMASALMGMVAIGSRIWWARNVERRFSPLRALAAQAALSVVALVLLAATPRLGGAALWIMSTLAGFSLGAWNAVAMLSIIVGIPVYLSGRASGIVMLGFMSGLSLGGYATGLVGEYADGYTIAWLGFAVLAAVSSVLALTGASAPAFSHAPKAAAESVSGVSR